MRDVSTLKPIGSASHCPQYNTEAKFYIDAAHKLGKRHLVVHYDKGGHNGAPEFVAGNAGDLRVFWQGPSLGYDFGVEGARTMMLVYNLPATDAIYQRFAGIDGSAYFVGGLGMTALTMNNIDGPDPHGGGDTAGRKCRLSQIHADGDLEPVLNWK